MYIVEYLKVQRLYLDTRTHLKAALGMAMEYPNTWVFLNVLLMAIPMGSIVLDNHAHIPIKNVRIIIMIIQLVPIKKTLQSLHAKFKFRI